MRSFGGASVDADAAFADDLLDAGAAQVGHALGEKHVYAAVRISRFGNECLAGRWNSRLGLLVCCWFAQERPAAKAALVSSTFGTAEAVPYKDFESSSA